MRLRRVEPILRRALRGPCRLPEGSRVLVALSGGADSTALLVALLSIAPEFGLAVSAAHLHHGLRGAEADGDLEHVQALCERLGVPLVAKRREDLGLELVVGRRRDDEATLRDCRRHFLGSAARATGAAAIATAHTADDQLETLLMRLARGTGLRGLGAMSPAVRPGWIKPMLEATRHDVERDLRAAGIAWREDSSNASRAYLRNRLRLDVVPALLAAIAGPGSDPEARAKLARRAAGTAADARAAHAVLARIGREQDRQRRTFALAALQERAGMNEEQRQALRRRGPTLRVRGVLDVAGWTDLEAGVRHALIARFWRLGATSHCGLTRRQRDAIDALACGPRSRGEVALPAGWYAVLDRPRLRLVWRLRRGAAGNGSRDGKLRPAAGRATPGAPDSTDEARRTAPRTE